MSCVTIVTYNMASFAKNLNGKHSREEGFKRVLKVLQQVEADVTCLQEVGATPKKNGINQAELLASALGMDYVFEQADKTIKFEYGIEIISKYPMKD